MKQEVGKAAAVRVQSGSRLGTGSTTAYTIQFWAIASNPARLNIWCAHIISGRSTVQYGIPLTTLDAIDHIDIAIDGADEVDPKEFD